MKVLLNNFHLLVLTHCTSIFNVLSVYPNDRIESLLQEAEKFLQKSEECEKHKDYVSALSYCTEAASEYCLVFYFSNPDLATCGLAFFVLVQSNLV